MEKQPFIKLRFHFNWLSIIQVLPCFFLHALYPEKIQVRHEVVFYPHSQHQRFEKLSNSSGGKEFVQGTQHDPMPSKTGPLKW
jgi:hypothetical protein